MAQPATHAKPLKVLLIDDEEDVTTYLETVLDDNGIGSRTVNRAADALRSCREFQPDLICLDLLMPEKMGLSLYLDIRRDERLRGVPVLIISGLNAEDELTSALADVDDVGPPAGYMEKPVDPEEFVEVVRGLTSG